MIRDPAGVPEWDQALPPGDRVRLRARPVGAEVLGEGAPLLVALAWDVRPIPGLAGWCDWRLNGRLGRELIAGRLPLAFGHQTMIGASRRLPGRSLLVVGLGDPERFDATLAASLGTTLAETIRRLGVTECDLELPGHRCARATAEPLLGSFLGRWAAESTGGTLALTALTPSRDEAAWVAAIGSSGRR